jgi:hypothetical protein
MEGLPPGMDKMWCFVNNWCAKRREMRDVVR